MNVVNKLGESINKHCNKNAFFIDGVYYTYKYLAETISKIREAIELETGESEKNIGLVANDDIETYATIFALWFEGKAYIPLSPETPLYRNRNIIRQAGIKTIIDSSEYSLFTECTIIEYRKLPNTEVNLSHKEFSEQDLAYILFTSGTTGIPKGVPITHFNLSGFIHNYFKVVNKIDEKDKFLQMFELTFDASLMSFLPAMLKGACVYTISKKINKYSYAIELMNEHQLTVALTVPSMLHYLRPYVNEIFLPCLKYSLLGGEALNTDVIKEWCRCVPKAKIINCYGPTEFTILSTSYTLNCSKNFKAHNGVLSIGKAIEGIATIIVDDNNQPLHSGKGELCLGGSQLTRGYWNNKEKNKNSFFFSDFKGESIRFYKTGDLCYMDEEGDIMYLGRLDFQTKIQGFRVELSEVEFHAKAFLNKINTVAIPLKNKIGNTEIVLIIESQQSDTNELTAYMRTKLPSYMIPTQVKFIQKLPLNINGKTDRQRLTKIFTK